MASIINADEQQNRFTQYSWQVSQYALNDNHHPAHDLLCAKQMKVISTTTHIHCLCIHLICQNIIGKQLYAKLINMFKIKY